MTKCELNYDIAVQQIPEQGYQMQFEATPDECVKIAKRLGLLSLKSFSGQAKIMRGDIIKGHLSFQAQVEQASVISLKPVKNRLKDNIDLLFLKDEPAEATLEDVALIEQGHIHLGELFIQYLSLALPDYPRNPGETFEEHTEEGSHPFAVLKNL